MTSPTSSSTSSTSYDTQSVEKRPLVRRTSSTPSSISDLQSAEKQPLVRRVSNRGEYISIAEKGKFKDMGTTSQLSLASTPEQIATFVTESPSQLHPKQLRCLMEYVQRNVDPSLLKIWSVARKGLRVKFADKAEVIVVSHNSEIQKFKITHRDSVSKKISEIEPDLQSWISVKDIDLKYFVDNELKNIDLFLAASESRLIDLAKQEQENLLIDIAVRSAQFICTQLYELLLANSISSTDFGDKLLAAIKANNQHVENVDKLTFATLVKGSGLPMDLVNAPEYRKLLTAFRNNSWNEDEEKEITFIYMQPDTMAIFEKVLIKFSLDPQVIKAMQQVLRIQRKSSHIKSKRN